MHIPTLVSAMEEATGHRFTDVPTLLQALTHTSYANEHQVPHNERLEFLGDSVVNLCATTLLAERFPDSREGDLTRLRQEIVNTRALGRAGAGAGITGWLRLGRSEDDKEVPELSIVGDAVEALFGALYLDGGFDACMEAARRWLGVRIDALDAPEKVAVSWKDPRSLLQEHTQRAHRTSPTYVVTSEEGPSHSPTFHVEVRLAEAVIGTGDGRTKKEAHRAAAVAALAALEEECR